MQVPVGDNYYAALNSAVFSDGSFVYIPKGVKSAMELSTYFRINAQETGQVGCSLACWALREVHVFIANPETARSLGWHTNRLMIILQTCRKSCVRRKLAGMQTVVRVQQCAF